MKNVHPIYFNYFLIGKASSFEEWTYNRFRNNVVLVNNVSARHELFPVTEIQQAYLIGRKGIFELGHVSCFMYQEYDLPETFNIARFEQCWNYLIQRHEALRIIFPSDTRQQILNEVPHYTISTINLACIHSTNDQLLEQRREELSHRILPANQWPLFDVQVTRFIAENESRIRLHIGIDILILDLWSINLLFYELQQIYHHPNISFTPLTLSYRDYVLTEQQLKDTII